MFLGRAIALVRLSANPGEVGSSLRFNGEVVVPTIGFVAAVLYIINAFY
jgi:hypothetical protein